MITPENVTYEQYRNRCKGFTSTKSASIRQGLPAPVLRYLPAKWNFSLGSLPKLQSRQLDTKIIQSHELDHCTRRCGYPSILQIEQTQRTEPSSLPHLTSSLPDKGKYIYATASPVSQDA